MARCPKYFVFFVVVVVFCVAIQVTKSQVTFSKGWGPGKRAALYDSECSINPKSFALALHTLMTEMKHLMACDRQATINYLQSIDH